MTQNDVFDYIKSLSNTIYDVTNDTILPHDNDNKPIDNVCAIEFGSGVSTKRLRDAKVLYITHAIKIHTRGYSEVENSRKVSRNNAESLTSLLDGKFNITQGTTGISYMSANMPTLTGVSINSDQAYNLIDVVVVYGDA